MNRLGICHPGGRRDQYVVSAWLMIASYNNDSATTSAVIQKSQPTRGASVQGA